MSKATEGDTIRRVAGCVRAPSGLHFDFIDPVSRGVVPIVDGYIQQDNIRIFPRQQVKPSQVKSSSPYRVE